MAQTLGTVTNDIPLQQFSPPEDDDKSKFLKFAVSGHSLYFKFGNQDVLKGLNINVNRGIIYGLLGPSGCGKTTLLRCIVGRHKPSSGSIKIYGRMPGQKGFCIPGRGVGFMPQELALYPEISIEETLTYFGRLYQMSAEDIKERITFLTHFLDLPDKAKIIKKLSGGQQRRVSFAAALIHKPPLIILDEPTVGVDPLLRKSVWDYLQKLVKDEFLTIILTTHYVEEARQAHVVGLMQNGRLLAESNPEYLIQKYCAKTLEDVFFILCLKFASEVEEDNTSTEEQQHERRSLTESQDDVWAHNKLPYNSLTKVENHGSDDQATFLNNTVNQDLVLSHESSMRATIQMSAARMNALIAKNFIRLKRNIPLVFFQLFVPTFQVIVFCLCVGGQPFNLPVAVVNLETDPSGKSNLFLESLNSEVIFQVPFSNLTPAIDSVVKGENWGVLYIKPSFTDGLIDRYLQGKEVDNETVDSSRIMLYLDKTNHQISMLLYTEIMDGFEEFSVTMLKQFSQNHLLAKNPLVMGYPVYGPEKPDFTEFMAPGMILGITYIMAVALSSMTIILERKDGLLDRSLIAGVKSWEVMFSLLFPLFITMLFQVALILLLTFLAFDISCKGPVVWVVIAVLLVGLEGMAYGVFISAICNDERIAIMIVMGSFYPNLLMSGIIWPIEAMPYYLKDLSYGLPITLIAHTMRCVLSKGWGITENGIWIGYLVAIAWIVPMMVISSILLRYRK